MTVIIGAVCESESVVIVAADRMAVFGAGSQSVRSDDSATKIYRVGMNAALLQTGTQQDSEFVVASLNYDPTTNVDIANLYDVVKSKSWERTTQKRKEFVQSRLGWECEFKDLLTSGANVTGSQINDVWLKAINEHSAGEYILAGFRQDGKAALYGVFSAHPHLSRKCDAPYSVNGSGIHFAYSSLVSNWPHSSNHVSLPDALFDVYCAKKAAEVSDGVGKSINLAVLTQTSFNDATYLEPTLEQMRVQRQSLRADERAEITKALSVLQETK